MSLNILITGSSGFLGSQLCKVLSNTNHKVIGVDIKKPNNQYKNIDYFTNSIEVFIKENALRLSEQNLIIHTASMLPYKSNKKDLVVTNIEATKKLVDSVKNIENLFFVYVSSSGIYGKPKSLPIKNNTQENPLDLYADTKLKSENYIRKHFSEAKFSIIRPRTILGKNRGGIFKLFFTLIEKNIPIPIPNNGNQKIQFVDVDDLTNLITHIGINEISGIWPAAAPNPKPLKSHLKNLGKQLDKSVRTFNINPKLFYIIGSTLISLRLTNFTKWHFGAFPHSFYFDDSWKPEGFSYQKSCDDTFMECANSFFESL
jgi:nucleoside-diphosphate-sugar epimerase